MNSPDNCSARIKAARILLARCGIDAGNLGDTEILRRADEIAAAAGNYRGQISDIAAVLDAHLAAEFETRDLEATMDTMIGAPYLLHVPVLTGGSGRNTIKRFYREDFIPCWPADTAVEHLSRTVGTNRIVDELIVSFTHDREMSAIIPGIAPTGKRVEFPHTVVVEFENSKIKSEHIYWDQATVLVQLGLLDPAGLPVSGAEQAAMLRNPAIPFPAPRYLPHKP